MTLFDQYQQHLDKVCAFLDEFQATGDHYYTDVIAGAVALTRNEARLFGVWLLSFIWGWFFFYCVRGTFFRHLYCTIIGFVVQLFYFKHECGQIYFLTIFAYLLMILLPRRTQAKWVFIFCFAQLSYSHVMRMMYKSLLDIDVCIYNMLNVCKLTCLAFRYQHGALTEEEQKKKPVNWIVHERPSILEMLSFTFNPQVCTVGTFYEFADWIRFIEYKGEYQVKEG